MFTIKHLSPMGNEALYEAGMVSFLPAPTAAGLDQPANTAQHQLGTLAFTEPGHTGMNELRDGNVYVMNENGSTVAKYDLGGWYASLKGEPHGAVATAAGSHFMKPDGRIG